MRYCAVDKCSNNNETMVCHTFPKDRNRAQKWQNNLNLHHIPLDMLISKYFVCYKHFDISDYRNSSTNYLNINALPQLQPTNSQKNRRDESKNEIVLEENCTVCDMEFKSIGFENSSSNLQSLNGQQIQFSNSRNDVIKNKKTQEQSLEKQQSIQWSNIASEKIDSSPVNVSDSIELLHDDTDDATEEEDNLIGTSCDGDSKYNYPEKLSDADALIQSIDGGDFTILDATGCTFMNDSKTFEVSESSVDLKFNSESDSGHSNNFRPDSTDSDVEVLVSESIFESQWSETDCSAIVLNAGQTITTDSALSPCVSCKSDMSSKTNELLDLDSEHLDRKQLREIINNQSSKIKLLEAKLDSFKSAQETLAVHFEAFLKIIQNEETKKNTK